MIWKEGNTRSYLMAVITLTLFMFWCAFACHDIRDARFYILMWTSSIQDPFTAMKMGKKSFIENGCPFQNCFITSHILQLSDVTYFDAVLFNSLALRENPAFIPPNRRHKNQKYVLVSTESSATYPLSTNYNKFFNWTWTYKLNSDVSFAQIAIRDVKGNVIGPKQIMHWIPVDKMINTSYKVSRKLYTKRRAAAWYVTDCDTIALYEDYMNILRNELWLYYFNVDILGPCGNVHCHKGSKNKCQALIKSDYYFYLAFENGLSEDYVSDQLLLGLNNYAVPAVFGGANYTRFMPDGIYLNAMTLGPRELAKAMYEIIRDRHMYHDMFKWHNHYIYHDPLESSDTNGICAFCALLNNDKKRRQKKVYKDIVKWLNEYNDQRRLTTKRAFEIDMSSVDKNRFEVENALNIIEGIAMKHKQTGNTQPPCTSVMTCAVRYVKDIKKKVFNWFKI